MKTLAKVLPGLIALFFLLPGFLFTFNPDAGLGRLGVTPDTIAGYASIRSFIGGTFLGLAVLLIHGIMQNAAKPIRMVAIMLAMAVLGRLVGLGLDGIDSTVIGPFVIEIVLVGVLLFSAQQIEASEEG